MSLPAAVSPTSGGPVQERQAWFDRPQDRVARATTPPPYPDTLGGGGCFAEKLRVMAALRDGDRATVEFRNCRWRWWRGGLHGGRLQASMSAPLGAQEAGICDPPGAPPGTARTPWTTTPSMSCSATKEHGRILWVMGPALCLRSRRPGGFAALVRAIIHGLLAGNALATHDLRPATSAPPWARTSTPRRACQTATQPHRHLNAIRLRLTAAFVEAGKAKDGIIYECVRNHIPYVLVGSVRDDGPARGLWKRV